MAHSIAGRAFAYCIYHRQSSDTRLGNALFLCKSLPQSRPSISHLTIPSQRNSTKPNTTKKYNTSGPSNPVSFPMKPGPTSIKLSTAPVNPLGALWRPFQYRQSYNPIQQNRDEFETQSRSIEPKTKRKKEIWSKRCQQLWLDWNELIKKKDSNQQCAMGFPKTQYSYDIKSVRSVKHDLFFLILAKTVQEATLAIICRNCNLCID